MTPALFALLFVCVTDDPKPPLTASAWLARATQTLADSKTAQWQATLEVLEAPPAWAQARVFPFHVGAMNYQFRVKGESRVYWAEKWAGKGTVPTRETWYEGRVLYVRSTRDPKKLIPIEVGEGEGFCIERSLVDGGILGWRLAHGFDNQETGGAYVAALSSELGGEEKLGDVNAVVLIVKIGFGFGPERARHEVGTTRLWIDKKTFLPIKRETTLKLGDDKDPSTIRVKESYTNWQLNQAIANNSFHIDGMGPPYPLVDAPKDPAAFETVQTEKFLGFPVSNFPVPQGPQKFDELPADAPVFAFSVAPRTVSGPDPKSWYESRKSVFATAPDGSKLEAYIGYGNDAELARGHGFLSVIENRRHAYGGGDYHPADVFIGKRTNGRLQPTLFFRDVGSHSTAPHTLAVDGNGRCHLLVADVDIGQNNRLKLYWLIGDPATHKWTQAWLVDFRDKFTSSSRAWSASWKDQVHGIWNVVEPPSPDEKSAGESGIFHVQWTPAGFGHKSRIARGNLENLGTAVDPVSGRLLLVFSNKDGVFVASKPVGGVWTRPTRLHPDLTKEESVVVQPAEKGKFVIRTHWDSTREWLLTPGEAAGK